MKKIKIKSNIVKNILDMLLAISIILAAFIVVDMCNHTHYRLDDDSNIATFVIKDANGHEVFTAGSYYVYPEDGEQRDKRVSVLYIGEHIFHLTSCHVDITQDDIKITYTYDIDAYSNYYYPSYKKANCTATQTEIFDRTIYSYTINYELKTTWSKGE